MASLLVERSLVVKINLKWGGGCYLPVEERKEVGRAQELADHLHACMHAGTGYRVHVPKSKMQHNTSKIFFWEIYYTQYTLHYTLSFTLYTINYTLNRAVASVENAPNLGAFSGAHEKQALKMEIYILLNFVIQELFGSIDKTHMKIL